jgi:Holliday junction resolvase-like predicted endonuclease
MPTPTEELLLLSLWRLFDQEGVRAFMDLHEWAEVNGVTESQAERAALSLDEDGLCRLRPGHSIEVSVRGVVEAEIRGHCDSDRQVMHEDYRQRLLFRLSDLRVSHGHYASLDWQELLPDFPDAEAFFRSSGMLLAEGGLIDSLTARSFRITKLGLEAAQKLRAEYERKLEFQKLSTLTDVTPQERGHRLEVLVADALRDQGWSVERNIKNPGEELDVVAQRLDVSVLISCKWTSAKVESREVALVASRAQKRVGFKAALLSVSGFTSGCETEVLDLRSQVPVILIGSSALEAILDGKFGQVLEEKLNNLNVHRTVDMK